MQEALIGNGRLVSLRSTTHSPSNETRACATKRRMAPNPARNVTPVGPDGTDGREPAVPAALGPFA